MLSDNASTAARNLPTPNPTHPQPLRGGERGGEVKSQKSKVFYHKGFKLFEWVLYLRPRPLVDRGEEFGVRF